MSHIDGSTAATYDAIRALRKEVPTAEAFQLALTTVATLVHNVLEHPEDAKFRTVRLANATFHARLGQFASGRSVLRSFGFEDAMQDGSAGEMTHLALADADAAHLAQALVLVEASRQASCQVSSEQQQQQQPATSASATTATKTEPRAVGKRPVDAHSAEPAGKRASVPSVGAGAASSSAAGATSSPLPPTGASGATSSAAPPPPPDCHGAAELEAYGAAAIDAYFVRSQHIHSLPTSTSTSALPRLPCSWTPPPLILHRCFIWARLEAN